jgi:hypothetical protein
MAKKKASRDGFNMAQAIRDELTANNSLTLKECLAAVQTKYPDQVINPNSFGVAFSNQRAKLGLKPRRGRRKMVRRRKPGPGRPPVAAVARPVNLEHLQAARKFVSEIGNAETAIAAVRQLATLQIS